MFPDALIIIEFMAYLAVAFAPVVLASRRDLAVWPWILLGIVAGPLSLGIYGLVRLGQTRSERRVGGSRL